MIVIIFVYPLPYICLCQAINRDMAPEYTDDQEEGERICCMSWFQYFPQNHIYWNTVDSINVQKALTQPVGRLIT